jgi:hypothetical protein
MYMWPEALRSRISFLSPRKEPLEPGYKILQKWNIFACSRYNANFKLDQSVFAIHDTDDSPLYFEISEGDTHAR